MYADSSKEFSAWLKVLRNEVHKLSVQAKERFDRHEAAGSESDSPVLVGTSGAGAGGASGSAAATAAVAVGEERPVEGSGATGGAGTGTTSRRPPAGDGVQAALASAAAARAKSSPRNGGRPPRRNGSETTNGTAEAVATPKLPPKRGRVAKRGTVTHQVNFLGPIRSSDYKNVRVAPTATVGDILTKVATMIGLEMLDPFALYLVDEHLAFEVELDNDQAIADALAAVDRETYHVSLFLKVWPGCDVG